MSRKASVSLPALTPKRCLATPKRHSVEVARPQSIRTEDTEALQAQTRGHSIAPSNPSKVTREKSNMTPSLRTAKRGGLPPVLSKTTSYLPPPLSSARNVLVIDLDETLVHCSVDPRDRDGAHFTDNIMVEGAMYEVFTRHRPFVMSFLDIMSRAFECVLFTAGLPEYADAVMDKLDPRRKLVPHRLYREHCTVAGTDSKGSEVLVKDLGLLGRDLRRVVILDNSPASFMLQPRNGIQIASWYADPDDRALLEHIPLLLELSKATNVVDALQQHYAHYF